MTISLTVYNEKRAAAKRLFLFDGMLDQLQDDSENEIIS
jgi:hypothetical protein